LDTDECEIAFCLGSARALRAVVGALAENFAALQDGWNVRQAFRGDAECSTRGRVRSPECWTPVMEEIGEPKVYLRTIVVLLALLATNWAIGYVDLGRFNLVVALAIAITQALIIALFFMHLKGSSRLLHLAAAAGVIWLLIQIALTLSDYFTRGWVPLNH
jgi:cytochrome c oxidase subunit IV